MTPPDITPGIHAGLPNADYHGATDWLGSTTLKTYLPEHYRDDGGNQTAFDFGTAFHTLALGDGDPIEWIATSSRRTKTWTEAETEARTAGHTPMLESDREHLDGMRQALHDHELAGPLMDSLDAVELSAFTHTDDGTRIKARFDGLTDGTVVDLKTTSSQPGAHALTRSVLNYGYDLSAGHYLDVAQRVDLDVDKFVLVFVAKTPPYRVTVCPVAPSLLARGLHLRDQAIARHIAAQHTGAPDYDGAHEELILTCPPWARLDGQPDDPEPTINADFEWSLDTYDYA